MKSAGMSLVPWCKSWKKEYKLPNLDCLHLLVRHLEHHHEVVLRLETTYLHPSPCAVDEEMQKVPSVVEIPNLKKSSQHRQSPELGQIETP